MKSVWRTANLRTGKPPIWFKIKSNSADTRISRMALAPSNSNYMWVAENVDGVVMGNLFRSENALATGTATPTWTPVDSNVMGSTSPLPNREITKILVDQNSSPAPDETVYVAFGGFATHDNLWRTTDHGQSWHNISGGVNSPTACDPGHSLDGLPCAPVRAIAQHPDPGFANILFVGTEIGIYVTPNVNETPIRWFPVMQGPVNVSIDDLEFIKGSAVLLAGTYGRGVWSLKFPTPAPPPTPETKHAINDFDGDGRSDIAVVRADGSQLIWHKDGSSEGYGSAQFGAAGDQIAAADYDGDGKADRAVYRASEQRWYSWMSSTNSLEMTQLGGVSDKEVPADFDGDGVADEAVFKPSTGYWEVQQSTNGHYTLQWGAPGDKPVTVDFTGDGKADYGVLHEETGMIALSYYDGSVSHSKQFGLEGDLPVSGDYDGDGKADIAFWRPDDDGEGNGCWYITYATNGFEGYDSIPWGENGDIPVPGDYDGDGKMDIAVFRPSTGFWHILESSNGYFSQQFGAAGDMPVGAKTTAYSARPGQSFQKAPAWAEPRRRTTKALKDPNVSAGDE